MDEMERKCRIFLGITPFNTSTNLLCGDPHYLTSLQIQYGKEKIEEKIKELKGEKEDMKVVEEKETKTRVCRTCLARIVGFYNGIGEWKYCPYCGAKLEKEKIENE